VKAYGRITPVFDEPNLVSHAGLAPVLAIADLATGELVSDAEVAEIPFTA
jgi:hypothetical protein